MARPANGSWNGIVMSAFSVKQRRILSLWLPRLPTDRIRRQRLRGSAAPAKAFSSEVDTGSRQENASKLEAGAQGSSDQVLDAPCIVVAKQNNALQISALNHAAARLGLEVGLPLANARAVCPDIDVVDADEAADRQALNHIADWCDR